MYKPLFHPSLLLHLPCAPSSATCPELRIKDVPLDVAFQFTSCIIVHQGYKLAQYPQAILIVMSLWEKIDGFTDSADIRPLNISSITFILNLATIIMTHKFSIRTVE